MAAAATAQFIPSNQGDVASQLAAVEGSIAKLAAERERLQAQLGSLPGKQGQGAAFSLTASSGGKLDNVNTEAAQKTRQLLANWRIKAEEAAAAASLQGVHARRSSEGAPHVPSRLVSIPRNISGMEYGK